MSIDKPTQTKDFSESDMFFLARKDQKTSEEDDEPTAKLKFRIKSFHS